ncbi:ABC transporter permease [Defluviitalea phaphyphila]|uniref:ABC transporter permease n=1 Tax=Defluviitalea phaphyphila TaxID=1473580 RepID=UPI0007308BC0|nr:ABC transporter permease [Defluviitalea phaphyphila]
MLKRIWIIFLRDLKVNLKDFLSLYIIIVPIIIAILINIFTPSINDTTINLALLKCENQEMIDYLEQFAHIELFDTVEEVKKRVEKRDNIIGILPEAKKHYIMTQGNEPEVIVEYAKLLKTFYELDIKMDDTNAEIIEFGRKVPPLKKTLVNLSILFISILGGMLITLNIIEEKMDNTISAINLTPTTRLTFLIGKSILGIFFSVFGSIALIFITGFREINILKLLLVILISSILSILLGIVQGLTNDDVMNAAGSVKLLFLPLIGGVLAIEMLGDKWQKFFYWDPFYWAYKGNDLVLSGTGTWSELLIYAGIIFILSVIVYVFIAKSIRKGLE